MPQTEHCDVNKTNKQSVHVRSKRYLLFTLKNKILHLTGEPQLVFHKRHHYKYYNTVLQCSLRSNAFAFSEKWLCNSIKKHSPSQQNHVQSTLHLGPDHSVWVYFVKMNVRPCKSNKSRLENQQCMSHSCKITQIFSVVMPTDSSLWAMGTPRVHMFCR